MVALGFFQSLAGDAAKPPEYEENFGQDCYCCQSDVAIGVPFAKCFRHRAPFQRAEEALQHRTLACFFGSGIVLARMCGCPSKGPCLTLELPRLLLNGLALLRTLSPPPHL